MTKPTLRRDDSLRSSVTSRLAGFEQLRQDTTGLRHAAVAVCIADEGFGADLPGLPSPPSWSDRAALILTRRATTLRDHPGQWALPGGRIEPGESPEQAALREIDEEIGLRVDPREVLGRLDDYTSRSGFVITPVVVWAGSAKSLQPNLAEVATIHRIPIAEFSRLDAPLLEAGPDPARPVLRMPVGRTWIAAPTAAVLLQFREVCIEDRPTRVAHFDQPVFAWK